MNDWKINTIDKIDEAICNICDEIKCSRADTMPALTKSLAKLILAREQINKI